MTFQNSEIFIVAGLLSVGGGLWYWWKTTHHKNIETLSFPALADLQQAQAKQLNRFQLLFWGHRLFFLLGLLLLIIALARPQSVSTTHKVSKNGIDMVIALDVSESMLAEDLTPNRLESAKRYIEDFVGKLKSDRVGLLVFAGKPFTQSPLTFDYEILKYYLDEISTDTINQNVQGLNGTAIGDAILAASNRLKNNQERTKVMVLLTDGEANVGVDPVFATEQARAQGVKIYTIGIGSLEGAPVAVGTRNGQPIYAKNPDGSLYKSTFDEKTLQEIAQISGGKYFYAKNDQALNKSLETIQALEKTDFETESTVKYEDHFWPWLWSGFLSLLIAFALYFVNPIKR